MAREGRGKWEERGRKERRKEENQSEEARKEINLKTGRKQTDTHTHTQFDPIGNLKFTKRIYTSKRSKGMCTGSALLPHRF